jgi:hypothetical protein
MSTVAAVFADDTSPAQLGPLTVLLDDPEWVTARFAEIMTAAGFGRRTVTGIMLGRPPRGRDPSSEASPNGYAAETVQPARIRSRVRSPPTQP